MKKLIGKMTLFGSGILVWIFLLLLIPGDAFTFRNLESMTWASGLKTIFLGEFYPNQTHRRDESGDLGHGSRFNQIKKNILWKTDFYGFRNDPVPPADYQTILVGDSNSIGISTSQEFILSSQLSRQMNTPVFNYSNRRIRKNFLNDMEAMKIRPKTVILQLIERNIPSISYEVFEEQKSWRDSLHCWMRDLLSRQPFLFFEMGFDRFIKKEPTRYLQSRIDLAAGAVPLAYAVGEKGMLFFKQGLAFRSQAFTDQEIQQIAERIQGIGRQLESRGIRFVFVPEPDKETVCFEMLPVDVQKTFLNRDFLIKLKKELDRRGVASIDLYSSFRARFLAGEPLYYFDDTHWNPAGIELAATLISQEINRSSAGPVSRN